MNMKLLLSSIKEHEGLMLKPYKCTENKLTIGYGRNLEDNGISEHEANEMLLVDIKKSRFQLDVELKKVYDLRSDSFPNHVQNVLIEMAFQLGVTGLMKFKKTIQHVVDEEYELASIEMLNSKWAKQTPNRAKTLSNLMKGGN